MPETIPPIPHVMVAPNGARRTKADHPQLPVTISEIVETAIACHQAGAGGVHAHVRDAAGNHVLDAGLYAELIGEMRRQCPGMLVQITTEAVGLYTPQQQRQLVRATNPAAVSVALREMLPDQETGPARKFYHWAHERDIAVQHILYDPAEVTRLGFLVRQGIMPDSSVQMLFVLGRYALDQNSAPADLDPFVRALLETDLPQVSVDWACCAFGQGETACLLHAARLGGKLRVGFENSLLNADGSLARDNADRVARLVSARAN